LMVSRGQERRTLKQTKESNERWFSAGNEGDIYSREDSILPQ
jgi:hypothetical protein